MKEAYIRPRGLAFKVSQELELKGRVLGSGVGNKKRPASREKEKRRSESFEIFVLLGLQFVLTSTRTLTFRFNRSLETAAGFTASEV